MQNRWIISISFFITLFGNGALLQKFQEIYPWSLEHLLFLASVFFSFGTALALLLLWVCHGQLSKWILISFLFTSSLAAYFMDSYGTVLDQNMLINLTQTNLAETKDLLSGKMLLYVTVIGILPGWVVFKRVPKANVFRQEIYSKLVLSFILLAFSTLLIFLFSSQYATFFREHKEVRMLANPTYPVYSAVKLLTSKLHSANTTHQLMVTAPDAKLMEIPEERKELIILVVGETARADRFSLNGYAKETNPELKKQKAVSFSKVTSCGTSTAVSVPCMFSGVGQQNFNANSIQTNENILDVLHRSGVQILWRDNNSDSKGVATRVEYQNFKDSSLNPICNPECRDVGMLSGLEQFVLQHDNQDILIVLHQMGSHGPSYSKRYPPEFQRFLPVCNTNELSKCTQEELDNAYDNSILYTDYFLSKTIDFLKQFDGKREVAMLYVSDHGESLGEKGIYLHGAPRILAPAEQTHVASVAWLGKYFDFEMSQLEKVKDMPFTHDDLFCVMASVFEIESSVCQKRMEHLQGKI